MPDDYYRDTPGAASFAPVGHAFGYTTGAGINSFERDVAAGTYDREPMRKPFVEPAELVLGEGVWVSPTDFSLDDVIGDDGHPRWLTLAIILGPPKRRVLIDYYASAPAGYDLPPEAIAAHRARCLEQSKRIADQVIKFNDLAVEGRYGLFAAFKGEAPSSEAVADAKAGRVVALSPDRPAPQPIYRPQRPPIEAAPRRTWVEPIYADEDSEPLDIEGERPPRRVVRDHQGRFRRAGEYE